MVKLSIIVPVYNVEKFVKQTIDSILNQSFDDFELILVDDGSNDTSGKICDEYLVKDMRVRVIHQENSGVSSARNIGIEFSSGEYITFVDGDDWIEQDTYGELIKKIEQESVDICYSSLRYEGENIKEFCSLSDGVFEKKEVINHLIKGDMVTSVDTAIYRREIIENVRFQSEILYWEDLCFQLEIIPHADSILIDREPFYHVVMREDSATHKKVGMINLTSLQIADVISKIDYYKSQDWIIATVRYKMLSGVITSLIRIGSKNNERKEIMDSVILESQKCVLEMKLARYTTFKGRITIRIISIFRVLRFRKT